MLLIQDRTYWTSTIAYVVAHRQKLPRYASLCTDRARFALYIVKGMRAVSAEYKCSDSSQDALVILFDALECLLELLLPFLLV